MKNIPAYVKIIRASMDGSDNWMHVIDPATDEVVGEGSTIMAAWDQAAEKGYDVMDYNRAMEMAMEMCREG